MELVEQLKKVISEHNKDRASCITLSDYAQNNQMTVDKISKILVNQCYRVGHDMVIESIGIYNSCEQWKLRCLRCGMGHTYDKSFHNI